MLEIFYDELTGFYDRISNVLKKRDRWVDIIFLDFQKAFDTTSHRRLMMKLNIEAVVRGGQLKWINNYLTARKQRTHVRETFSSWACVTNCVP